MRSRAVSLPRRVLRRDAPLAAAEAGLLAPLFEPLEDVLHALLPAKIIRRRA